MFEVHTIPVTAFEQNCRVLAGTQSAVVVDPGGDSDKIVRFLEEKGLNCEQIWLTHSHLDHCGGVAALLRQYPKAQLFAHKIEREFRASISIVAHSYGLTDSGFENCPEPSTYIEDGTVVCFEDAQFQVLFTPGHSPGHVCFYSPEASLLIGGDLIFAGSVGRTDLPGGSMEVLKESIRKKVYTLPDDTKILPGHGPETILKREKKTNPFVREE